MKCFEPLVKVLVIFILISITYSFKYVLGLIFITYSFKYVLILILC
jgi:hypothetical protein